jgi:hypothetical protein
MNNKSNAIGKTFTFFTTEAAGLKAGGLILDKRKSKKPK